LLYFLKGGKGIFGSTFPKGGKGIFGSTFPKGGKGYKYNLLYNYIYMDVNKLLKALDDETNETLMNFTTDKIREMNLNVLKELHLPKTETLELLKKLKDYKYVDEMNDLKYGAHIRWIPLEDPENIHLKQGAMFCEMKIKEDGVYCLCKNYGFKSRHFYLSFDKQLIFQKLTDQELVLLSALDHLSK
jgi:hypothetical protein